MNALVIYFDRSDEICINYAREFADRIYVLKVTKNNLNMENLIESRGDILKDIESHKNLFDVIVLRKRESTKIRNFEIGNLIEKLKKYRLLVIE